MQLETVFSLCSGLAIFAWVLIIVSPKRWPLLVFVTGKLIPVVLSLVYASLILPNIGQGEGGFGSLAEVRLLFSSDLALLAGWIHYLAFDLAIGTIIAIRADKAGISRLIQVPILLFTFLLGPIGFALFFFVDEGWKFKKSKIG